MKQILLYILVSVVLFACKTPVTIIHKNEIKNINPQILYDSLKANYGSISTFYGKFKVVIKQGKKTNTLYGVSKLKNDSIAWFSINPGMGIEVARAIFLKDSFAVIDRLNSRYFKGNYNQVEKLINVEVDFSSLQSIFLNTLSFFCKVPDTQSVLKNVLIKKEKSGKFIQLENFQKRTIRRNETDEQLPPIYERIFIDNRNLKISEVLVRDFKDNKQIKIIYSDFLYNSDLKVDFPQKIDVFIEGTKQPISVSIQFQKQQFNEPNSYPFSIPESYKNIDLK